ncbi:hypothetical protein ACFL0H_10380 [Thermodesulfobacteriota bacterium]
MKKSMTGALKISVKKIGLTCSLFTSSLLLFSPMAFLVVFSYPLWRLHGIERSCSGIISAQ